MMLSESELIKQAREEARQIIQRARREEANIIKNAYEYVDKVLITLEENLNNYLTIIDRAKKRIEELKKETLQLKIEETPSETTTVDKS